MITLQALCQDLDLLLETSLFRDGCPNGLQIEGNPRVKRIAVAVSASLAVIERAIAAEVDLLLVHHGIFWNKEPLPLIGIKKCKVERLLRHGISLVAYHLPLDAHPIYGNNARAAYELGWKEIMPFGYLEERGKGPAIGVKGSFTPCSIETFQQQLEQFYRHPAQVVQGGPATVRTAALVSGGAHRMIEAAIAEKVDCFITGSFDEPTWHQAREGGVHFFAMGHFATERVGPRALGDYIATRYGIESIWMDEENPF